MKKRTLLALAVAMSVTAVAAANPFSDVPAKHWAYDSVMKLEKAGIVEGFPDGTFRGQQNMTRYEMAQIIARAMARVDKADAALKAELDKLSVEFAQELKNLGVRVTALENQTQNVKFSGDLRLRYDNNEQGVFGDQNSQKARFRLQAEGKVNDNWSAVGRFRVTDDFRGEKDNGVSSVYMDKLFVKGQMGAFGVRAGRLDVFTAYGVTMDSYIDGIEMSYTKDNWYGAIRYGRTQESLKSEFTPLLNFAYGVDADSWTFNEDQMVQGEIGFALGNKANVKAAYTWYDMPSGSDDLGIWEVGADYTFATDWKVTASVADTTGDFYDGDTVWFAQLDYKGANRAVVNSWGAFAGYRDFDNSIAPAFTTFNKVGKGWYVGGSFTPAKNVVVKAWYENMKNEGLGINSSQDYVRAQAEFFFQKLLK